MKRNVFIFILSSILFMSMTYCFILIYQLDYEWPYWSKEDMRSTHHFRKKKSSSSYYNGSVQSYSFSSSSNGKFNSNSTDVISS